MQNISDIEFIAAKLAEIGAEIDTSIANCNDISLNETTILDLTKAMAVGLKFVEQSDCYCVEYPGKENCYKCATISQIREILK